MNCEPLQGKTKKDMITAKSVYRHYFDKDDVKSAVEFFKKYRNDISLLYEENSDDIDVCIIWEKNCSGGISHIDYENWLFDYCFGDVME